MHFLSKMWPALLFIAIWITFMIKKTLRDTYCKRVLDMVTTMAEIARDDLCYSSDSGLNREERYYLNDKICDLRDLTNRELTKSRWIFNPFIWSFRQVTTVAVDKITFEKDRIYELAHAFAKNHIEED